MTKKRQKAHKKQPKILPTKKQCLFCGSIENLTIHHIIPRSIGGTDDLSNLVWLCGECHQKLHQILLDQVIKYLKKNKG